MLFLEQLLNGIQLGFFLFLLSCGLTLIFGIMGVINLAHGSFYMIGAYFATAFFNWSDSFLLASVLSVICTAGVGLILEFLIFRHLYERDHLEQVLACVGLIYFFDELMALLFGKNPQFLPVPWGLENTLIIGDFQYSSYRIFLIILGLLVATALFALINKTRIGMQIRAGQSNRTTISALGVNINKLFALVFALGIALAALAGVFAAPLLAVQISMGNSIIILVFVCIIIGGLGSIKGALIGAMLVGISDTMGRIFLPDFFNLFLSTDAASMAGSAASSMTVFILMIVILLIKPQGLFQK